MRAFNSFTRRCLGGLLVRRLLVRSFAAVYLAWLAVPADAVTYTWTAGSGAWDDTTLNWNPNTAPGVPQIGDVALLTQSSGTNLSIDFTATNLTTGTTGLLSLAIGNTGGGTTTLSLDSGDLLQTGSFTLNPGGAVLMTGGTLGALGLPTNRATVLNGGTFTMNGGLWRALIPANGGLQVGNGPSANTQTGHVVLNLEGGQISTVGSSEQNLFVGGVNSGTFTSTLLQTGGTMSVPNFVRIYKGGTYSLSGGSVQSDRGLQIFNGGNYVQTGGTSRFGGADTTINSGGTLTLNMASGTFQTARGFSTTVNAGGALNWSGSVGWETKTLFLTGSAAAPATFTLKTSGTLITNDINNGGGLNINAFGILEGYGAIQDKRLGLSSEGILNNSGRVIANGDGVDQTLDLSRFNPNTFVNTTDNTGSNGWFATNQGRLVLPNLSIASTGTVNWGEAQADTTLDLVNSMRLTSASVTSGSMSISLMATDRTDVATALSTLGFPSTNVLSLFKLDPLGTFAFGSGNLSLQVRYDDSNVAPGTEGNLRLMRYNAEGWTDITSSVDFANKTITSQSLTSFGPLSDGGVLVSVIVVPEPSAIALAGIGGTAAAWRFRRRRGRE